MPLNMNDVRHLPTSEDAKYGRRYRANKRTKFSTTEKETACASKSIMNLTRALRLKVHE